MHLFNEDKIIQKLKVFIHNFFKNFIDKIYKLIFFYWICLCKYVVWYSILSGFVYEFGRYVKAFHIKCLWGRLILSILLIAGYIDVSNIFFLSRDIYYGKDSPYHYLLWVFQPNSTLLVRVWNFLNGFEKGLC